MAKAILSSILESQLGKYVDGLSGDSLQVGLWSGEMLLQNLSLKPHALAELNLPVTVIKGTIRRIHVIVPWNQLGSSSVQILIEGIHALVVPNTKLPSQEELHQSKRNRLERAELLRQHDRLATQNNAVGEDESTFLSRLTERIVDNLKITLKDIHFRYEDSISNPDQPFVCGIMIQSFAFHTTDAEGVEVFVDRTTGQEQFVHKVAKLFQLCAYWDRVPSTAGSTTSGLPQVLLQDQANVEEQMDRMIYLVAQDKAKDGDKDKGHEKRVWILKPCSMDVQLTKNETMDYAMTPKYTINANLHAICIGLSREQYEDVRFVEKSFAGRKAVEAHFMGAKSRPFHGAMTRPLDWWDYAVHGALVRKRKQVLASRNDHVNDHDHQPEPGDSLRIRRRIRWSSVERSCLERKLYVEAFRAQRQHQLDPNSKHAQFMQYYEFLYPVDVVMALRSWAEDEQAKMERTARKSSAATSSSAAATSSGSWYSYFFAAKAAATSEDAADAVDDQSTEQQNVLTEKGRAELKQVYDSAVQKEATLAATAAKQRDCKLLSARVHLRKGALKLYNYDKEAIVSANIDGSIALLVRPSNQWEMNFRLQNCEIFNCRAKGTRFHQFCTISSAAKRKNPTLPCVTLDASCRQALDVCLSDESSALPTREILKFRISSMPLRVMVDVSFLVFINDFFMRMLPDSQLERVWDFATSSVSDFIFSDEQEEELIANITALEANKPIFDVVVDMSAPVVVFTEDMREQNAPAVVVDLGRFSFKNDVAVASTTTTITATPSACVGDLTGSSQLFWRLDIQDIQVLLGRNGDLIEAEDDKFSKMCRLVNPFTLDFSIQTTPILSLAPPASGSSSRKSTSPINPIASETVPAPPQTLAKAHVPRIIVSISEEQIVKLGRIHSSMLNQMADPASGSDSGSPSTDQVRENPSTVDVVPVETPSGTNNHVGLNISAEKANVRRKSSRLKSDKHKLRVELLLESIVLHLLESAQKDAFCLVLTQSALCISVFSSKFIAEAKLKSLVMEDRLYNQTSPFFKLASTGDGTSETGLDHLIAVTVVGSTQEVTETVEEERQADLLIDMKFNVLDIQWNPSSIALLYRIVSSYVDSLQEHSSSALLDKAGEGFRNMWNDDRATISFVTSSLHSEAVSILNDNRTTRSRRPTIMVCASLVKLSVTFNKDDINRQLVCLSAQQASVEFTSWSHVDNSDGKQLALYELHGVLGNFVATDLSLAKHEYYSPLLGLDSRSSYSRNLSDAGTASSSIVNGCSRKDGLLRFSYRFDEFASAKSFLELHFRPVRLVYLQQQILEIVDYFYEGILGALISQTILSATQLLLNEEEATVVFNLTVEKPSVVFPIRLEEETHIKLTADALQLDHFPLVKMLYWFESDPSNTFRLARRVEYIKPEEFHVANGAFRADLKTIKLEGMNIFCFDVTRKATNSSKMPSCHENGDDDMQYLSLLSSPVTTQVVIEDLASCRRSLERRDGKRALVPRFTIEFQMSRMNFCIPQQSYLIIIAMIQDNFCGEPLAMNSRSSVSGFTSPIISESRSPRDGARPSVAYSYSRTDLEAITIKMVYGIASFQCRLIESRGDLTNIAIAEVAANKLELSINYLRDENPSIAVRVKSIGIRDLVGSYPRSIEEIALSWSRALGDFPDAQEAVEMDMDMSSMGMILICRRPVETVYSWDTSKLSGNINLHTDGLRGVVIPDAILRMIDFFTLPTKLASVVGDSKRPRKDSLEAAASLTSPTGRSTKKHRSSITAILLENQPGPQYDMTISVLAKKVLLIVPQDTSSTGSAEIQIGSDFEILYTCTPDAARKGRNTQVSGVSLSMHDACSNAREPGGDLNINSSFTVEARGMEIVVLKFEDPAEPAGDATEETLSPSTRNTQLVQIMEPCVLHGEVTELYPTAGQQQQIIALKFSPIEVFISYDDLCIINNTTTFLSESINRHSATSVIRRNGSINNSHDYVVVVPEETITTVLRDETQTNPGVDKLRASSSVQDAVIVRDKELDFHRYCTCQVSSMSLTLINDCDGCDMGLLQLAVSRCNAFLNTTYEASAMVLSGGGGFATLVSYYNPDTRVWHPMCREWNLEVVCQGRVEAESLFHSDNSVQVIVTATQTLDLTITHGLLEVAASTGGAWNRRLTGKEPKSPREMDSGRDLDQAESSTKMDGSRNIERKKHAPCVVRNETGLQLQFWLTIDGSESSERQLINDGELTDLHYNHRQGKGSGLVRKYTSQERDDNMQLCIHLFGSSFQPIRGIIVEQLGSRAFPLIEENGGLSMYTLNLYTKLVDGRILLSISSQIKLISKLSMPLQLLVNDPTWKEPIEIPILVPAKESAIPVMLSLATELRIKPLDDSFAWSAPIPIQTRANADLKVESPLTVDNDSNDSRSAVFAVTMILEQSLRIVCFGEPIVLVNKLPTELQFSVKSPLAGVNAPNEAVRHGTIGVGGKNGISWIDRDQRPLFSLWMEGCESSRWMELIPTNSKKNDLFSTSLKRIDGRPLKLIIQVVEHTAKSVHVFFYADIWFINRTGLELVLGSDSDEEYYMPPTAARSYVGNAQICAYSTFSDSQSTPRQNDAPTVRLRMATTSWSSRFEADPRKMSWQEECLTLRSKRREENGVCMLYEFGVSADYSTRHFGSITTLVSVIPRYLVINRSSHTVLLTEESFHMVGSASDPNSAHHILTKGDEYALYWLSGVRSKLRASVLGEWNYRWSDTFSVDLVNTIDLVVPCASPSGRNIYLQVSVKSGGISRATNLVLIEEVGIEDSLSLTLDTETKSHATALGASSVHPAPTSWNWDNVSFHVQIAGVVITIADRKQLNTSVLSPKTAAAAFVDLIGKSKLTGGATNTRSMPLEPAAIDEEVAKLTILNIRGEFTATPSWKQADLVVGSLFLDDLLPKSKNPRVLRPVAQTSTNRTAAGFLSVNYAEKVHPKYTWIEKLSVQAQDMNLSTTMKFVDRLNTMVTETISHFESQSYSTFASSSSTIAAMDDEIDANVLEYFISTSEGEDDSLASVTGRKIYMKEFEICPVRVIVSFSRDKNDSRPSISGGFWLQNLKLKIENACLTMESYRLGHALATRESLFDSVSNFYVKSVKSQALGLIDSIQVSSLVTSMVTGGVSSLMTTIMGKTDPKLSSASDFRYEFLTNQQCITKHSNALATCRSPAEFQRQVRHLVFDWDSNHTGLEARGCVALGILNNSRHSLVFHSTLKDGAEMRILPVGRKQLAGVSSTMTGEDSSGLGFQGVASAWRSDRAVVIFAWGYTPTLLTSGDVYFHVQCNACNIYVTRKTARLKANLGYSAAFTSQETQNWWSSNIVIVGDDLQGHMSLRTNSNSSAHSSTGSSGTSRTNSLQQQASFDLFGSARFSSDSLDKQLINTSSNGGADPDPNSNTLTNITGNTTPVDEEYEVIFTTDSLGLVVAAIAIDSGRRDEQAVLVDECLQSVSGRPGPALKSGKIQKGDRVLSVNGVRIFNTKHFRDLVKRMKRPIAIRFRKDSSKTNPSAFDLFGEMEATDTRAPTESPAAAPTPMPRPTPTPVVAADDRRESSTLFTRGHEESIREDNEESYDLFGGKPT